MKLAFLGKGGSGKTTLATAAVQHFLDMQKKVLAIDADHNMDLMFNLGATESDAKLGSHPHLIKKLVGVSEADSYSAALAHARRQGIAFRLAPPDDFTSQVSVELSPSLRLIAAGPHTDTVRSGQHCSHSLAAPLKVYMPLLTLNADEVVVMDERAGADPVATGILKGVDKAIIVVEPTVHSVRVAIQISDELRRAKVPHIFAVNKFDGANDALASLPCPPSFRVPRCGDGSIVLPPLEHLIAK